MSCWVVPAVAAEFWGLSIEAVLQRVRDGHISHKTEQGFLFVDVAPWSTDYVAPKLGPKPPTFTLISDDEPADTDNHEGAEISQDDEDELLAPLSDEESESFSQLNWDQVRQQVGRTRRPPMTAAA